MSNFPKYIYNGIDLILIPGKNYSKNTLINRLKKMNIKVNYNKYLKSELIKIYDDSLKDEKNIEKILENLISDTNSELKINLSPSNFKRKKGNIYQNMDNNNNINGNEQNLNQKNINGDFPIYNNNLVNNVFREDGFPNNNKNEEKISLIKQKDNYNDNLFSNQSLKENTNICNNNYNNNKNDHNDNYNNNDYHNNKVNNNNNNDIKNKDDNSINYNENKNNNFSNNINSIIKKMI